MKFAALLLALSATAAAQTNTGEITGIVRDVQGDALPGARVIAEHVDTGVRVEYPADESGRYHLVALRVGMYVISVELQGFRRVVRSGVIVQLGQSLNLDFTLDVGGPVEERSVSPPACRCCRQAAPRSVTSSRTSKSSNFRSTGATSSRSRS